MINKKRKRTENEKEKETTIIDPKVLNAIKNIEYLLPKLDEYLRKNDEKKKLLKEKQKENININNINECSVHSSSYREDCHISKINKKLKPKKKKIIEKFNRKNKSVINPKIPKEDSGISTDEAEMSEKYIKAFEYEKHEVIKKNFNKVIRDKLTEPKNPINNQVIKRGTITSIR